MQLGYFIQRHATHAEVVPIPVEQPVSDLENDQVIVIEGWH